MVVVGEGKLQLGIYRLDGTVILNLVFKKIEVGTMNGLVSLSI